MSETHRHSASGGGLRGAGRQMRVLLGIDADWRRYLGSRPFFGAIRTLTATRSANRWRSASCGQAATSASLPSATVAITPSVAGLRDLNIRCHGASLLGFGALSTTSSHSALNSTLVATLDQEDGMTNLVTCDLNQPSSARSKSSSAKRNREPASLTGEVSPGQSMRVAIDGRTAAASV
jgi:hypothetical protein